MSDYEQNGPSVVVTRADFQQIFDDLHARGYSTIAPKVEEGAIVYGEVATVDDLPIGWTDDQGGGFYRLERRADDALFGYTVGPHSWKRYFSPPVRQLWQARKTDDGFEIVPDETPPPRYALIGVRACELHAIQHMDDVYLGGSTVDADYQRRRAAAFLVAVNCGKAGNTCFCASLETGPAVGAG